MRISVVVPATNRPSTLARTLAAIQIASDPPEEVIVVSSPRSLGPAAARNAGARTATGEVLVFVDADVEVDPRVFQRVREHLGQRPTLSAVFGSYDDSPSDEGVVSAFRNLLHHYVPERRRPRGHLLVGHRRRSAR